MMPLSLLCALALTTLSDDRDPQLRAPYELQVVVSMAHHPLITSTFQEQVERQLRDNLQSALGELAHVSVANRHPLLPQVEAKGLEHAFDDWKVLDGRKLHFVLIDFAEGRYKVQARQYDGFTGLASPVVRRGQTADRSFVDRMAALLVAQDFGLDGTIEKEGKDKVEVRLKGAALAGSLEAWLKEGDVFAVAEIQEPAGANPRSIPAQWVFLQATEKAHDGLVTCEIYHRYDAPLANPQAVYRCTKLGVLDDAPLVLRLVAEEPASRPLAGRQVQLGAPASWPANVERKSSDADGLVHSDRKYKGLALAKIAEGGKTLANVPVAIIDDRPVTIAIRIESQGEEVGKLYYDRLRWLRRVAECLDTTAAMIRELNGFEPGEASLAKARACLKTLHDDVASLSEDGDNLRRAAAALLKDKPLDLGDGERQLEELRRERGQIESYVASMEDTLKREKDPKRIKLRELAGQARLLEGQADYQGAIDLYRQVIGQGGDDPQLRRRLGELEKAWAVKDDSHRQARDFIYRKWANAQTAVQVKARLRELHKSFEICREANDHLTPQKLLLLNLGLVAKLEKEAETLHPQDNDDDRRTAQTIVDITQELKKVNDEVRDFSRRDKGE
jgi:hypothetical protein